MGGFSLRKKNMLTNELSDLPMKGAWIDSFVLSKNFGLFVALWGRGVFQKKGDDWIIFDKLNIASEKGYVNLHDSGDYLLLACSDGVYRFDGVDWSPMKSF